MNDKLLPCPFCGSTEIRAAERGLAYAECRKCDAYGPSGSDGWGTANNMWNQRTTTQPQYREPTLEDARELSNAIADIEEGLYAAPPELVLQNIKHLGFYRKVQP